MYPNLFGIEGFSMTFMIIVGVLAAGALLFIYLHKNKVNHTAFLDLGIIIVITVFFGIVFAILVENAYEAIKATSLGKYPQWTWGMTFFGGLLGGIPAFLLSYKFYYLKHNEKILDKVVIIAPACITLGHAFGRIGCFLSGCCYGIETDAANGVLFPGMDHYVVPTQIIESLFLFSITVVLAALAFKRHFHYNFVIYCVFYGVFRFIIEFFRGDERGQLAGLSPSQYWCIVLVLLAFPLYVFLKYKMPAQVEDLSDEI